MSLVQQLLSQVDSPFTAESLFDQLPDIVFFIKNNAGEYVAVNTTLVQRCGVRHKSKLVGRRPSEVLGPLGSGFEAQDRQVLQTGKPMLAQLELHIYPSRDVGWCVTTKLPLKDKRGKTIGLVGVSHDLGRPKLDSDEFEHVAQAIRYAESRLDCLPSVQELADIAQMSRYQLDRRIRHVFGVTTGQWLQKMRIDFAQQKLSNSDDSISSIALQVGYADQSAFTRQFRQSTGMSPRQYRQSLGTE